MCKRIFRKSLRFARYQIRKGTCFASLANSAQGSKRLGEGARYLRSGCA